MSLYHKYRPQTLEEVQGNKNIIEPLSRMLNTKDSQAFLLHGPTGCGKTTIGRIIANELGCRGNDLREINAADFRGIDTIRDLRSKVQFKALEGDCQVWIVDECHKLSNDAQNAFLKLLEDPPKNVYFILCTTEPEKLLKTIKGRCSIYQVSLLSDHEMMLLLRRVVKGEEETLPKPVYNQIIQDSLGHPRNALQILEQVLLVEPESRLEVAKRAELEKSESIELCRSLLKGEGWKKISGILTGLKDQEPESIRRHVLGYAQSVLLSGQDNERCGLILEEFLEPIFTNGFPQLVYMAYTVTKN